MCGISVTLMSELQAPVDPDCADCEGVVDIVLQIEITAMWNINPNSRLKSTWQ